MMELPQKLELPQKRKFLLHFDLVNQAKKCPLPQELEVEEELHARSQGKFRTGLGSHASD